MTDDHSRRDDGGRDDTAVPGAVDARFTLAAERTMLAWLRTCLGLLAAGVAVMHVMGDFAAPAVRNTFGVSLIVLGALAAILGAWRWQKVTKALERGGSMPGPAGVYAVTAALVLIAIAFVFVR